MSIATVSDPILLSETGSTRATAYHMTNKTVRIADLTHVTWLDAIANVCLKTYNHADDSWSDTLVLDEGEDNHTNPALTAAPDGHLRIIYGPHGWWSSRSDRSWNDGKFRLKESVKPNDAGEWRPLQEAGYGATYASFVTDSMGVDHLAYRGGPVPHGCMYERRHPGNGGWDVIQRLSHVRRSAPQYTFVGATIMVGANDTLYAGFQYFDMMHSRSHGVCALRSDDHGCTWTGLDGTHVSLPLHYNPHDAIPHGRFNPYIGGLAIDGDGSLVALTYDLGAPSSITLVSTWTGDGWRSTQIDGFLPDGWDICKSALTVDTAGRVLVAAEATPAKARAAKDQWGHIGSSIFLLASEDGEQFDVTQVCEPSTDAACWLPNISRTGPNHDMRRPLVMWTEGVKGDGCAPSTETKVWAAWVD